MNQAVSYFTKRIVPEIVAGMIIMGASSGVRYATKKFFEKKVDRELKEALRDS